MYQPPWQSVSLIFGHQDQAVKRTLCILLISRICPQKHDCGSNGRGFVISRQNCHVSSLQRCHSALLTPGEETLLPSEPHPPLAVLSKFRILLDQCGTAPVSPMLYLFTFISGVPCSTESSPWVSKLGDGPSLPAGMTWVLT